MRAELSIERVRPLRHGFHSFHALDDGGIPNGVQIGRVAFVLRVLLHRGVAKEIDGHAIASHIVVGNAVQRLMKVSHKMDDKPQGVGSHLGGVAIIAKQLDLMLDRTGHAAGGGRAELIHGGCGARREGCQCSAMHSLPAAPF